MFQMMEAITPLNQRGDTKMEKQLIIQMMSTDRKINAIFKRKGYAVPCYEVAYPVVGVALVEDMQGDRNIKTMYIGDKGLVEFLDRDQEGFIEIRPEDKGLNIYSQSDKYL
ncbi:hypothetical protein [Gudongella sp. DL1XJH-153]|uniref:hypothetical protein n=1 Tax=Gudongella sp. DL1XJH-153 TaxID=3409804 RepID=UPI003BB57E79